MLGDFNTRASYRKGDHDVWSGVPGHHRLDVRNQAWRRVLKLL